MNGDCHTYTLATVVGVYHDTLNHDSNMVTLSILPSVKHVCYNLWNFTCPDLNLCTCLSSINIVDTIYNSLIGYM